MNLNEYIEYLAKWIKNQVLLANAKGVIIGISGGIDSAVVATIAKNAFPDNTLGVLLPINNKRTFDLEDGIELCKKKNINYKVINLEQEFNNFKELTQIKNKMSLANLQARLRMATLYALAQENNYLVLGTDNLSEYELGYFTKFGDGACDLLPIVNLFKSEIFKIGEILDLPINILNKKPSGGLWENQEDEEELGFKYYDFEQYYKNEEINDEIKQKIIKQINATNHKRKAIPRPDIFPKR
ncbi:MAG: NAD(+) synthase [Metamycoplasmataceae bacterium]